MAKKFMYVCLGVLMLAAAFHLGAQYGQAGYVDQSTQGIVATSDHIASEGFYVLLEDGQVWQYYASTTREWGPSIAYNLPVPVSEVKFWAVPWLFYTVDNEA